jgi:hypothetical protein
MPRLTLRRNGVLIKTKFAPEETESQSAEIIINSLDVKYDFGFIRRSGTCQSANGFFQKQQQWVSLFLGVCGLISFFTWLLEENLGSMQLI